MQITGAFEGAVMPRGKTVWQMVGEALREVAVLAAVFFPLEGFVRNGFDALYLASVAAVACAVWSVGVVIEVRRRK